MLERLPRKPDLVGQYSEKLLRFTDPLSRRTHEELLRRAMGSVIYGPIIERYVTAAIDPLHPDDEFSPVKVDNDTVAQAIDFLADAAIQTESIYALNRPGILQNPNFLRAMTRHHENVANGIPELIPEEFAMTKREGQLQVAFADERLTDLDPRAQLYLAGLNYAAFTGKTMCT